MLVLIFSGVIHQHVSAEQAIETVIYKEFRYIDSTLSMMLLDVETAGNDIAKIKSLFSLKLHNDSSFHSFIIVDKNGKINANVERDSVKKLRATDVSDKKWFSEAIAEKEKYYYEVTRIGDKFYLLKSRYLHNAPKTGIDSTLVFAVLVDLEYTFMKLQRYATTPLALLQSDKLIYESNWIKDIASVVKIPGYHDLVFAVAHTSSAGSDEINSDQAYYDCFGFGKLWFLFFVISLFLGLTGLGTFLISRISLKRMKKTALIERAHSKLPQEEKERIHRMAVSHVYCEIKRRIETHEADEMEIKIREEISQNIRKKIEAA